MKNQAKNFINLFVFSLIIIVIGNIVIVAQTAKTYQFKNGNWFNGKTFKKKTFYSVNGFLSNKKPKQIDEVVDLKNGYVIPPFADAHTHNLDGTRDLSRMSKAYLNEGTFYVQVLGNHNSGAKQARPLLNKPSTLDVIYANASLTGTYGHPFMVYEPLDMGIYNVAEAFRRIEEVKKSRLAENEAYFFLDSKADVDKKWEKIIASQPDILKIMLIEAENYENYWASGDTVNKGLSPEVAEYVVQKAHRANLRVYAHIETANDFRTGLKIGVDGFAHAPYSGWNGSSETKPKDDLTVEDMKIAARKNIVVIPTAQRGTFSAMEKDSGGKFVMNQERRQKIVERHRELFRKMYKNGVKLALGLDNYGTTLAPELFYFHDERIFDNLTLLKIAAEMTPQTIFPNRKIAFLKNGYEANFLVLENNPLENFDAVKNITYRFKQGFPIKIIEQRK